MHFSILNCIFSAVVKFRELSFFKVKDTVSGSSKVSPPEKICKVYKLEKAVLKCRRWQYFQLHRTLKRYLTMQPQKGEAVQYGLKVKNRPCELVCLKNLVIC